MFTVIADTGFLPEEEGKKAVYSILTAIMYCHDRDVTHRDIKVHPCLARVALT